MMKHQQLRLWLKDYYHFEFKQLSNKYKDFIIDYILDNNKDVFTADDVTAVDYCIKCGRCCKSMRCDNYDEETHLCKTHDDNRWIICQTAPYGDPDFGLMLHFGIDCDYLVTFLIKYFDRFFEYVLRGDKNDE